jgi:hypothetical protein
MVTANLPAGTEAPKAGIYVVSHKNPPHAPAFAKDGSIRKLHDISDQEVHTLSRVARMGEVRSSRDFVFILNTIRHALGQ